MPTLKKPFRVHKSKENKNWLIVSDRLCLTDSHTPSSSYESSDQGTITWDSNNLYISTSTNNWKQIPLIPFGSIFNYPGEGKFTSLTIENSDTTQQIHFIKTGTSDALLSFNATTGKLSTGATLSSYSLETGSIYDSGLTASKLVFTDSNKYLTSTGSVSLTSDVSGTLPVANGGTGATTFTAGRIPYGNGTSALNTSTNLMWDYTNSQLQLGAGTYTNAVLNIEKNNTDYTNTNGAGAHIFLSNANSSGQVVIMGQVNNANAFKLRTDSVSNLTWVSYASASDRGHYFFVNGDYPSGTCKERITNAGTIVGSSVVSSTADCPFEVETTSAIAVQAMTIDQNDEDQAFIDYQGTSAADASKNISTMQGDGDVDGPRLYAGSNGWFFIGMVKVEINGVAYWMPYYDVDSP